MSVDFNVRGQDVFFTEESIIIDMYFGSVQWECTFKMP